VILRTSEEVDLWLEGETIEALKLQRPLQDGSLRIVARGEKEDGARMNFCSRATQKGSSALSSFGSAVRRGAVTAALASSSRSKATPSSAARPNSTGQPKKRANSDVSALRACANATRIGRTLRPASSPARAR
jgi:hypothetical protein